MIFFDYNRIFCRIIASSFFSIYSIQAWNLFKYYFCRNRILMDSRAFWDFWKTYSIRLKYSTFKHFCVCSASNEIVSLNSQLAMKYVPRLLPPAIKFLPRMFSIFSMMIWNGLYFPLMLSMCKNWLLISWACVTIGYSLAELVRKLVTLSFAGNWLYYYIMRNHFSRG